jgi:hypothetical protein
VRQDFTVLATLTPLVKMKIVLTMFKSIGVMQRKVTDVQDFCLVYFMADLVFFVPVKKMKGENRKQEQSREEEPCHLR